MFELHVFGYGTLEWLVNCFLRPLEGYSLLKAGGFMGFRNLMVSVIKKLNNVGTSYFGLWNSGMARQLKDILTSEGWRIHENQES